MWFERKGRRGRGRKWDVLIPKELGLCTPAICRRPLYFFSAILAIVHYCQAVVNRKLGGEQSSFGPTSPFGLRVVGRSAGTHPSHPTDFNRSQNFPPNKITVKTMSRSNLLSVAFQSSNPGFFCSIAMSRSRSMKTKKQRHGRRSSTNPAKPVAKPVSPVPVPAKPAVDSTPPPESSPKSTSKSTPSSSFDRRAARQDRKLKARVRLLEKKVAYYDELAKHLARAVADLATAKAQIRELNMAVTWLLCKTPDNGQYYGKV